jgi:hypothetical protein
MLRSGLRRRAGFSPIVTAAVRLSGMRLRAPELPGAASGPDRSQSRGSGARNETEGGPKCQSDQ